MQNYLIVGGMHRSATTLQYQIARQLAEEHGGRGIWYFAPGEFQRRRAEFDALPGVKVIKVHEVDPYLNAMLRRGEANAIYSWRDLRDVVVSWSLRPKHTWINLSNADLVMELFTHYAYQYQTWTRLPRVTVMHYADVIADVPRLIQTISGIMGWAMRKTDAWKLVDRFMPETLIKQGIMPADHVNDGRAGMWADHVTPEQLTILNDAWERVSDGFPVDKTANNGV